MTRETVTYTVEEEREEAVDICDYCGRDETDELGEPVEFKALRTADAESIHLHEACRRSFVLAEFEAPVPRDLDDDIAGVLTRADLNALVLGLSASACGYFLDVLSLELAAIIGLGFVFYISFFVGYIRAGSRVDKWENAWWLP